MGICLCQALCYCLAVSYSDLAVQTLLTQDISKHSGSYPRALTRALGRERQATIPRSSRRWEWMLPQKKSRGEGEVCSRPHGGPESRGTGPSWAESGWRTPSDRQQRVPGLDSAYLGSDEGGERPLAQLC